MTLLRTFCLLIAIPGWAAPRGEALPSELHAWIAAQKNLGSVHVPFTQTRSSPTLKNPAIVRGHFWRMADGRFRWEVGEPATMTLVSDRRALHFKDGLDGPWTVLQPDDARMRLWMRLLSGEGMDAVALTKNFNVEVTQRDAGFVNLTLIPRALLLRRQLQQLDLQITPDGSRLLTLRVLQGDGGTLLIRFDPPEAITAEPGKLFGFP